MEKQGKVCSRCGEWKPLEEYYKDKTHKDGRSSYCKKCKNFKKETREGMKKCTKCGEWKPLEEFHKSGKHRRKSQCKECKNKTSERRTRVERKEGMKKCTKCGEWKLLEEYHKHKASKDGRTTQCKECKNKPPKETREGMKKCTKCGEWKPLEEYHKDKKRKDGRMPQCKECKKEYSKQHYKDNEEYYKQYQQDNTEHRKEYNKQWNENNPEYRKQRLENIKENNLQYISSIVEPIRPIFKELNLPVYGYIYKFENIKTGHVYIGQTIQPLDKRYGSNVIKSWIKDRKKFKNQKFLDELIEEDFMVTEVLDVGCCKWHLNAVETDWIAKYDSCNNGYNNNAGHHDDNEGFEEFVEMLQQRNADFIDGQIVRN